MGSGRIFISQIVWNVGFIELFFYQAAGQNSRYFGSNNQIFFVLYKKQRLDALRVAPDVEQVPLGIMADKSVHAFPLLRWHFVCNGLEQHFGITLAFGGQPILVGKRCVIVELTIVGDTQPLVAVLHRLYGLCTKALNGQEVVCHKELILRKALLYPLLSIRAAIRSGSHHLLDGVAVECLGIIYNQMQATHSLGFFFGQIGIIFNNRLEHF